MRGFALAPLLLPALLLSSCGDEQDRAPLIPAGTYRLVLDCPGGSLPMLLEVEDGLRFHIRNGSESIRIPEIAYTQLGEDPVQMLGLRFDIDSQISLWRTSDRSMRGTWRLDRGPLGVTVMPAQLDLTPSGTADRFGSPPGPVDGDRALAERYRVRFSSSEDPAVFAPKVLPDGRVEATFLTTLGDYRYLAGTFDGSTLHLSCFDGAHAFLFRAERNDDGSLTGDFWSRNSWHETWTATPDAGAALPDGFGLTQTTNSDPEDLRFPDLDGKERLLTEPSLTGTKGTVWIVFGSWCPNCHDATRLWAQLYREYRERGLQVVGLAFERSEDLDHERVKVAEFVQREGVDYPVLIAGLANKQKASEAFPVLDRVRAFPTTIFRDAEGTTRAVHTGFSGPATGSEHDALVARFRELVEQMLDE